MWNGEEDIPDSQKIAIVGVGCRYAAGVDTLEKLWEVLTEGKDCTSGHPENRYDVSYFLSPGEKLPGKIYTMRGGFLTHDIYAFDRKFFRMSQDEAQHLDPNIRLSLEVTWEALENAGIPASSVRGSNTGVYMGAMSTSEYRSLVATPDHNVGRYTNSGNQPCMISNRVSYEFDFNGPSLTLDTACSSSLYAIYLACEALKSKQCEMAVAGGVNILLLPSSTIGLCQAGMVSHDGRSKSFDKSADGYSRGEGAGVIILKTLTEAIKNNDRIYAVFRGGALSNDGRTTGITSPSTNAQRKLLESACLNACIVPKDITYAEAHGTGTSVGDKTEASVLGEVLGHRRSPEQPPLLIGSIKSNLGHTEAAAGVAGVIKAAMCLKEQLIPKVVHFTSPNPSLDFDQLNLRVPQSTTPWPNGEPLIASCSSFGFGGSNACMILEAAPNMPNAQNELVHVTEIDVKSPALLLLSAASNDALQQRLCDWLIFLQRKDVQTNIKLFRSVIFTASQRSHHHQHRIALVVYSAKDAEELIRQKIAGTDVKHRCVEGISRPVDTRRSVAFVFSGMGTQWWGMARELMHTEPMFASVIQNIENILEGCGCPWSLVRMLTEQDNNDRINDTEIAQPCICAVQIGLVKLWKLRGVAPDVVVGHSVGEVAASYCCGHLSLEQAIRLIYQRGRLLQTTSGSGTMVAVLHPVSKVLDFMQTKGYKERLDVAAINGPNQIVISGESSSIADLVIELKTSGIRCVQLKVRNAFHSRQQDCLENTFKQTVSKIGITNGTEVNGNKIVPMISTVTGHYLKREEIKTVDYWWRNIRQSVLFKSTIESLIQDDFQVFIEIGAHPVLLSEIRGIVSNIQGVSKKPITVGSLQRPRDTSKPANDRENLLLNHARLFVEGVAQDFASYFNDNESAVVAIPQYPWQRETCTAITNDARDQFQFPVQHHPLLGEKLEMSATVNQTSSLKVWKSKFDKSTAPWIKDHVIGGAEILPAAALIEVSLAAAKTVFPNSSPLILQNVNLQKFMYVPEGEGILETTVLEMTPAKAKTTIRSHDPTSNRWTQHAEIDIEKNTSTAIKGTTLDIESITKSCRISVTPRDIREIQEGASLTFGPSFQTVTHAFANDDHTEVLCYCEAPDVIYREFNRYIFHPALLDSCFQSYAILLDFKLKQEAAKAGTLKRIVKEVPSRIQALHLFKNSSRRIVIHMTSNQPDSNDDGNSSYNITIADADTNDVICEVIKLQFQSYEPDGVAGPHVWSTEWSDISPSVANMGERRCLLLQDKSGVGSQVADRLETSGVDVVVSDDIGDSKDAINQYLVNQHFTDILVLTPFDLDDAMQRLNNKNWMSLEQFRQNQQRFPLFFISLIRAITALERDVWPRVMICTSGAHAIGGDTTGELENPFLSYVRSIIMTCSYEEPQLNAVSVDLPQNAETKQKSSIVCDAFRNFPIDENMLAYRITNDNSLGTTSTDGVRLMATRLKFAPTSVSRINTSPKEWIITPHKGKANLSLKMPSMSSTPIKLPDESTVVDVLAFSTIALGNEAEHQKDAVTVFAGSLQTQLGDAGKRHNGDATKTMNILSMTKGIVSPSMAISKKSSNHIVVLPANVECPKAIELFQNFLPAQLFFQNLYPLSKATKVMFMVSNNVPDHTVSFPLLACAKGAQVNVVLTEKDDEKCEHPLQYENCGVLRLADLDQEDNSTVDLLIVPMFPSSLVQHIPDISPKLKKSALILYLFNDDISPQWMLPMMPGTKFMTHSASLSKALCDETIDSLCTAARNICNLSRIPGQLPPSSNNMNKTDGHSNKTEGHSLSTVPLVNRSTPDSTIISVSHKEMQLPFDLHANKPWVADKGSYLVTGGTSGFGLSLMKWLVSSGATDIFVLSRRPPDEEACDFIAAQKAVTIQHFIADISDAKRVEEVLVSIKDSDSPPLTGIFHLAARYNDGFIFKITKDSWNSVAEPKAYGALLLHQLTQKLDISLKYFVVSSSIVTMIGNGGQVSYCAANNFTNSLCQMRHHQGLPATALCIGYINSVGYAALNNLVRAGEERGIMSIDPEEVLKAMHVAMTMGTPQLGIAGPLIVRRFVHKNRAFIKQHMLGSTNGKFSLFKGVNFTESGAVLDQTADSFRQKVFEKSEEEARALIKGTICKILATQLGIQEDIHSDVSLVSTGIDSLMATTVSESIVDHFEVTINAVDLINDKMTIDLLYQRIIKQIIKQINDAETSVKEDDAERRHGRAIV